MDKKASILIVDDLPENLLILEDLLFDDYNIFTSVDGEQALQFLQQHPEIDLILMDVMMPVMDGFEACQKIKASTLHKDTPLLFITSLDSTDDETYGLSLGAEDFIQKPFSPPVVKSRIKNHLQLAHTRQLLRKHNDYLVREASERSEQTIQEPEQLLRNHQQMIDVQFAAISALCSINLHRHNFGPKEEQAQNYIRKLAGLLSGKSEHLDITEALQILQSSCRNQFDAEIIDAMRSTQLPVDTVSKA